jgi:hypothetical protein
MYVCVHKKSGQCGGQWGATGTSKTALCVRLQIIMIANHLLHPESALGIRSNRARRLSVLMKIRATRLCRASQSGRRAVSHRGALFRSRPTRPPPFSLRRRGAISGIVRALLAVIHFEHNGRCGQWSIVRASSHRGTWKDNWAGAFRFRSLHGRRAPWKKRCRHDVDTMGGLASRNSGVNTVSMPRVGSQVISVE